MPVLWRQASMEYVARHVFNGEPYKADVLERQVPLMEEAENAAICRPMALWSAAIIRLRMVEQARLANARQPDDAKQLDRLRRSIHRALACSPAQPFLWLVLYSLESPKNESTPARANLLRMSYRTGPYEGWVILKRSPVAIQNFQQLPGDVSAGAVNEFVALLGSQYYQQAVAIFSGAAARTRDAILPHLADLSPRIRQSFAKGVYHQGLDIVIPGASAPSGPRRP